MEPPSERFIHSEIYRARPEVNSVVHFHPPIATSFSIAGREILPVSLMGRIFAPFVPIFWYPGLIDSKEKGEALAKAFVRGRAILLRGHGAVTAGESLAEAGVAAVTLEETAKMQLIAALLGRVEPIYTEEFEVGEGLRRVRFEDIWHAFKAKF